MKDKHAKLDELFLLGVLVVLIVWVIVRLFHR